MNSECIDVDLFYSIKTTLIFLSDLFAMLYVGLTTEMHLYNSYTLVYIDVYCMTPMKVNSKCRFLLEIGQ